MRIVDTFFGIDGTVPLNLAPGMNILEFTG